MIMLKCLTFGMLIFLMTGAQCEVTEVFAEAGSHAVLSCNYESKASVQPSIVWRKANKGTVWRMQRSGLVYVESRESESKRVQCPHPQYERGDYNLHIDNVRNEDGGVYTCILDFEHQTIERVTRLRVITVSISPVVPILMMDVSIHCGVTHWPNGASVHWMLNNSPFVAGITSRRDPSARTLRIKATEEVIGNWTCVVGYNGKQGRASAALSVRGIIQPPNDSTKVYAAVGSAVTLPCVFSPGLIPSASSWQKLGTVSGGLPPSFSPIPQSSQPPEDKSARVGEVGLEDKGTYRCLGTIRGQRLTREIHLVVAQIESKVSPKKRGSINLTCQLSDTSEVTGYEWIHVSYDINGTWSAESVQQGKTLTISQVSEETWGEWVCRFSGKEGVLGNVTYHVQLMGGLSGQKLTANSQNTGMIVGLSFLLVVLLLILAQMYKNHQRRKRIFQYPALETIVHNISNEREEREKNRMRK
ncbi:lymphocyte activation gene 3 protein [Echeneis naucrates]|uniref:Ig-like domain-containing protein n=1 Tax=Echeneis naucrates TaxID=173247 RepID=A0A665TW38_ECHNA|nr:lymphocyte activation gene 3 protein [Echeneis naucrates]